MFNRRASSGRVVLLDVNGDSDEPLYRQVYGAIRHRILDGVLGAGVALPSTRALASDLSVSRSTVILAYEQLRAEGYVQGRMGAATRVSESLPDRHVRAHAPAERRGGIHAGHLSARARAVTDVPRVLDVLGRPPRAFRIAVPAVDMFPVDTWGRLLARRWRRTPARSLAYGEPFGYRPLREAVAAYLGSARGVRCTPDQVMIVSGSQEALDLACRVTLNPGDSAWIEDPGYFGARGAFASAGADVVPVPVDHDGMIVQQGIRAAPDARLAFVTPARQLPLGVTMSLTRRLELIEWARGAGAWILEDDYDSEFRYAGRPLAALQGLDPDGSVIYIGTFSKVMFPSLRLGYVVMPPALADAFGAMKQFASYSSPYLEQAVLADFIADGHFERHIRRTRAMYRDRQALLVERAKTELAGRLSVAASDAGMTLIGWLPSGANDVAAANAARARNVDVVPLSVFATRPIAPGLLLGYAGVREDDIRDGVTGLARALDDSARHS